MIRLFLTFLLFYILIVAVLYCSQRILQYAPNVSYPGTPVENGLAEMQEIRSSTDDGQSLYAWFSAPREEDGKIFVIYHGNAGNLSDRAYKARKLLDMGYGVYMCEYRGYGGNAGHPTEEGLYKDARTAIIWLIKNGYDVNNLVLYGESIGSGVAVQMASEFETKYMVLEGGFSSAVDLAKNKYPWLPVSLLLKDRYDNLNKMKELQTSLIMLHGQNDKVVNIEYGRKLFDEANHPKQFVELENGGHVDLFNYGAGNIIKNWLENQ